MSYAEAKQIALLRLELRSCWERHDYTGAGVALAKLALISGTDHDLEGEVRRWTFKLQVA